MRHLIISALFIIVGLLGIIFAALWECVKELDRGFNSGRGKSK